MIIGVVSSFEMVFGAGAFPSVAEGLRRFELKSGSRLSITNVGRWPLVVTSLRNSGFICLTSVGNVDTFR